MKIKLRLLIPSCVFLVTACFFYTYITIFIDISRSFWISIGLLKDEISTKHFVRIPGLNVYVYSAVVDLPSSDVNSLDVRIAVWDGEDIPEFSCCFRSADGKEITSAKSELKSYYRLPTWIYYARQFSCTVPVKFQAKSVFFTSTSCDILPSDPLPVIFPAKFPNQTAFCVKIAYAFLPPANLVEYFEIHKILGVSKFLVHILDVNTKALEVLEYYQRDGYVDIVPIQFPGSKSEFQRQTRYKLPLLADAQIAVYDCMERLSGFDFVGIVDFDEILLPSHRYKSIPHLLTALMDVFRDAASFTFGVENFMTNWNESDSASTLHFMKYVYRNNPRYDRPKCIHIPGRVRFVWTHEALPHPKYKKYRIPFKTATIHHYRRCRRHITEDDCMNKIKRFQDRALLSLEDQIKDKVDFIKNKLGL